MPIKARRELQTFKQRYPCQRPVSSAAHDKILEELKIPVLSTATGSILDSTAFNFVEITLKLANSIRNTSLFNQFLSHPFVGLPIEMITTDLDDPLLTDAITRFSVIATLLKKKTPRHFLELFYKKLFSTLPLSKTLQKMATATVT